MGLGRKQTWSEVPSDVPKCSKEENTEHHPCETNSEWVSESVVLLLRRQVWSALGLNARSPRPTPSELSSIFFGIFLFYTRLWRSIYRACSLSFIDPETIFSSLKDFVLSSGCLFLLGDREEGTGFLFCWIFLLIAIVKRVSFFRFRDKKRWLEREEEEEFWVFTCGSGFFRLPLDHIRPQGSHSTWWARVLRSFWCNCQ
jgi:cellulose synthase/poly-beta-1,6-N-acetylglucosamine synthase-like glycosyltransferase